MICAECPFPSNGYALIQRCNLALACGRNGGRLAEVLDILDGQPPPPAFADLSPTCQTVKGVIRQHVLRILNQCRGNQSQAARILKISRSSIYRIGKADSVGQKTPAVGAATPGPLVTARLPEGQTSTPR